MIELVLNPRDGLRFVRYIFQERNECVQNNVLAHSTFGRSKVRLVVTPEQLDIFRHLLRTAPDKFENPAVLLRGFGKEGA